MRESSSARITVQVLLAAVLFISACNSNEMNEQKGDDSANAQAPKDPAQDIPETNGGNYLEVPEPSDEDKSFIDYCLDEPEDEGLKKTITTLKAIVNEKLCGVAQAKLDRLKELNLSAAGISDLRPLRELASLETLMLDYSYVKDLSAVGTLKNLRSLSLVAVSIKDYSPLANLKKIETLNLNGSEISDMTIMSELSSLVNLSVSGTAISDLTGIESLSMLRSLNLAGCDISDAKLLAGLTTLQSLNVNSTKIKDLSPLNTLSNLIELDVTGTPLQLGDEPKTNQNCPVAGAPQVVIDFCNSLPSIAQE